MATVSKEQEQPLEDRVIPLIFDNRKNGSYGQLSLVNKAEYFQGAQLGLLNAAGESDECKVSEGAQIGFLNVVENLKGAQVGVEGVSKLFLGAQVGVLNFTDEMAGAQLGFLNLAKESEGAQIGAINYSGAIKGAQIGALTSIAAELDGLQFAPICYARDGNYFQIGLLTIRGGDKPWYRRASPIIGWSKRKEEK